MEVQYSGQRTPESDEAPRYRQYQQVLAFSVGGRIDGHNGAPKLFSARLKSLLPERARRGRLRVKTESQAQPLSMSAMRTEADAPSQGVRLPLLAKSGHNQFILLAQLFVSLRLTEQFQWSVAMDYVSRSMT